MNVLARLALLALFITGSAMPGTVAAAATQSTPSTTTASGPAPTIGYPVHMDRSRPLRSIAAGRDDGTSSRGRDRAPLPYRGALGDGRAATTGATTTTSAAPALGTSFEGVGQGFTGPQGTFTVNAAPPDPNGAVGPNHYVETVNTSFAIFNKSGAVLYGPAAINTLWSGFGGGCQTNNDGDPMVLYDRISDRWIISQFSVSTTPYLQCVAVSTTGDPTGSYYRYSYSYGNVNFPDYPKFGVWPDAYYVTFNIFAFGMTFTGAMACSYDRSQMLVGGAATQVCFNTSSSYGGLLPSSVDGATLPPAGSPNYLVALGASANQLAYWQFHSDFATPANSTFTGPTALAVNAFTEACNGGTCIPQAGTSQQLDSLADRLMYRLAYRNFGDHEALVVNHSISAGTSVGVRWYELRVGAGNTLSVYQQGTYAPDTSYRWMGSAAMDQAGDIGLGFSVSSSSLNPEIHYTGRLASDPLGTMPQGEGTVINGTGSQSGNNLSRWGDYTSLWVDPSDDCTFWYTNEYLSATGSFNWHTRVGTFKFAGCGTPPPANDFSMSASPSSLTLQQGASGSSTISTTLTRGTAETVTFSASGLPAGATATFNPASVTAGGSSTLTIATATTTPAGSYTVTVTGTAASATHTTNIALTVTAPNDFSISASPSSLSIGQGNSGTSTISTTVTSGSAQTISLAASGLPTGATATFNPTSVTAGGSSTLTITTATTTPTGTYTVTVTGSAPSGTHATNIALTVTAPSTNPVTNGGFESGTLSGWTSSGVTAISTTAHSGSYSAQVGSASPYGGTSRIQQTFSVPSGLTTLTFWYMVVCTDTVSYDWATATLRDNTTGKTTTVLPRTCSNNGTWASSSVGVTAGHSYTLTLSDRDDGYPGDPTYTLYDDVSVH